jgi:hypothetical protein
VIMRGSSTTNTTVFALTHPQLLLHCYSATV